MYSSANIKSFFPASVYDDHNADSHSLFRSGFSSFPWELLESEEKEENVFGFKWRHWGYWGERLEDKQVRKRSRDFAFFQYER